jgi:predicted phosphodiesterase
MPLFKTYRISSSEVTLFAIGDIHYDEEACDRNDFRRAIDDICAAGENARVILMGDTFSFLRKTDREAMNSALARMSSGARDRLDDENKRQVEEVAKLLEPLRGRVLFNLQGNHGWTFKSGITNEQMLAELLGADWSDGLAHVNIVLNNYDKKKKHPAQSSSRTGTRYVKILAHHGYGTPGSRRRSADVGHFETTLMPFFDADIYLLGHTHDLHVSAYKPVLRLSSTSLPAQVAQYRWGARTGSFVRGYAPGRPADYAESKLLAPALIGYVRFDLKFKRSPRERLDGVQRNVGTSSVEISGKQIVLA